MRRHQSRWQPNQGRNPLSESPETVQTNRATSVIYYVKPLHQQAAYCDFPRTPTGLLVSEALPRTILCLPMHPYLSEDDQRRIADAIAEHVDGRVAVAAEALVDAE